jgi:GntR family transcriptional repressor for pyruvate dehydrogenase complex
LRFEAVQIHSVPEMLAEQIVGQIQSGELQPGARMPSQRELARLFGVGLGTVRESVKILNAMGYLEVVRGKGTFIAPELPDREREEARFHQALEAVSLAQLMRTREIVECGAAREAAGLADPEGVARLEQVLEALRETARDDRVFYPVDFDFHIALAEATGNEVIVEIVKLLVNKAHHYIEFMGGSLKTFEPFNIERAIETAEQVVEAVAAGDAERAGRAMHAHLNIINYELEKEFPIRGGPPPRGDPEAGDRP